MVWCGVMELRLWASSCFVSRSQYGPFYPPHSPAGWWLETNQVHFYAYFPLTFLSAGHWRLAAGGVSISGVSTDPTSECVAAGPSPPLSWSRWVKSVQINFMILSLPAQNARQHTGENFAEPSFLSFEKIFLKRVLVQFLQSACNVVDGW